VPRISIHKLCEPDTAALRTLQEIQALRDKISRRAYDLYQVRGASPGSSIDDWLRAEREVCWVPAQEELQETDRAFHLRIGMSDVPEEAVEVTLLPEMVILRGAQETGSGEASSVGSGLSGRKVLFRQIVFPSQIHTESAVVRMEADRLRVSAAKTEMA
jgi:HSP20 family molecular chaperone IbpA